jgi:hypothetical protein
MKKKLKMRRQLNTRTKPPLNWQDETENKQAKLLFMFVTGPAESWQKQHYLHEDRLDMLEVGRAL